MINRNKIWTFEWNYDPNFRFPPKYPFGAKYLLCESPQGDKFIAATSLVEEHKKIKDHIYDDDKVLGGGCIYYYGEEKGFVLTDSSLKFGPADHEEAKRILNQLFPNVPVVIEK